MCTRFTLAMAATLLLLAACTERQSSPTAPIGSVSLSQSQGPDRRFGKVLLSGAHRRGDHPPTPSARGDMTNHGGAVMTTNVTYALFSGPDWQVNGTFTGDKITSIESFLTGLGGSPYAGILTEYSSITSQSSYLGRLVNNGTALSADANASDVVNFVCGELADSITARSDAIYIVFTQASYTTNLGYLGWHSDGTCQSVDIKVALVLNLDGQNFTTDGVYHSSNAAALVNVMAHEIFEAATDPNGSAWFATSAFTGEIGDKCNFVFNGYTQLANSDHFKVQTEWSNIANDYGVGLRNYNGEPGCEFPAPLEVYITGPQDIPLHESDPYTAHPSGGAGGYTYEWQQRFWWQGVPSSWSAWFSSGSTNYTYASINACRIDAFDLAVRVTDAYGSTDYNFIHVGITNPCG